MPCVWSLSASLVVMALAFPGGAPAAEDGVTIDPSSPSAKEYALPLETARRDANGEQDVPVKPGDRSSELFGAGVSPAEPMPAERARAKPATARPTTAASEKTGKQRVTPATTATGSSRATPPRAEIVAGRAVVEQGTSSTLALVGGGAGVLLLVGLGGAALRATRGPDA